MNKLVYLAGPITGCSYAQSRHGWRVSARKQLNPLHDSTGIRIDVASPLRNKGFLEGEIAIKGDADAYRHVANGLAAPKGIVTRDRWDCQRADLVLVNFLEAQRVSIGTCIEFGWADAARVPRMTSSDPRRRFLVGLHFPVYQQGGHYSFIFSSLLSRSRHSHWARISRNHDVG